MAEIIFRFPSKVPYGYAEVRFEASEVDPERIAQLYASDYLTYKKAEEAALTNAVVIKAKPAITKPVTDILSEDDVAEKAVDLVVKELGGVPVEETGDEPWNNKPEPAKKEWAAPAESAWDFS